jgi:hypothetical protein
LKSDDFNCTYTCGFAGANRGGNLRLTLIPFESIARIGGCSASVAATSRTKRTFWRCTICGYSCIIAELDCSRSGLSGIVSLHVACNESTVIAICGLVYSTMPKIWFAKGRYRIRQPTHPYQQPPSLVKYIVNIVILVIFGVILAQYFVW